MPGLRHLCQAMGILVACFAPRQAGRGLLLNHERTRAQTMGMLFQSCLLDPLAGDAIAGPAVAA